MSEKPQTIDEFNERFGTKAVTFKALTTILTQTDGELITILRRQKTQIEALEQEIAALKATAYLKDAGLWRRGAVYGLGDVAQFSGSAWVCTRAHTANGPTVDHTCWRLWIKKGKDGRDVRA